MENPKRWKKEVKSTGLFKRGNHWNEKNYTSEMFEGLEGEIILVPMYQVISARRYRVTNITHGW